MPVSGCWIASGTGEPAISAAQRVQNTGQVIGNDLVEDILVFAREKAAQAKLNNIESTALMARPSP